LSEREAEAGNPRVIFLDIDGVLAPIRNNIHYGDVTPACMQVLNDIVERSGAAVVVSSSLRFGKTVAELQELLMGHGFRGRVIGKTPTETRGLDRGEEIAAWLTDHPAAGCVILDDHRDMGALLGYLVQTNATVGLQPADAERALATLAQVMTSPAERTVPAALGMPSADPAHDAARF
jgi:hypothetical protein